MKTLLTYAAEKLALYAGVRRSKEARVARVALWLVFLAACNVSELPGKAPRAAQGIVREVKGA